MHKFEVPKKAHGDLIGRGGSHIRQIQGAGVRVKIPNRDSPERTVTVEGTDADVAAAKQLMEQFLGWHIGTEPLGLLIIKVPSKFHGRLIGSGRSKLDALEAKHGCNMHLPRRGGGDNVELEGPPAKIGGLKEAIEIEVGQECEVVHSYMPEGGKVALPVNTAPPVSFDPAAVGVLNEVLFFELGYSEPMLERFLDFFRSAAVSIDVCVFSLTHNAIAHVLLCAHKRGVKVRLISDDDQAEARGSDVDRLAENGIPVRKDNTQNHMHHKFSVIDNMCVLNGSFNYTVGAEKGNEENVLITNTEELVKSYAQHFDKLWAKYA